MEGIHKLRDSLEAPGAARVQGMETITSNISPRGAPLPPPPYGWGAHTSLHTSKMCGRIYHRYMRRCVWREPRPPGGRRPLLSTHSLSVWPHIFDVGSGTGPRSGGPRRGNL